MAADASSIGAVQGPAAGVKATDAGVRRGLVALVAAYVLASLPLLVVSPVANRAEQRCAEVVGHMVASGDWLVPRLQGSVRLNKPPLAYWTGALVSVAAGRFSLAALRLPSLAAAVGLLLATYAWGRRAGGPRLGLAAAACLATMELAIAYGHRGVAEMQLALACNSALLCFDRLLDEPRLAWRVGFGLSLGLALLAKATAGLMIVGLPVAFVLWARRRWGLLAAPRTLAWIALGFALGLSWYAAILRVVPASWTLLRADLLLPVGGDEGGVPAGAAHYNPPWFHVGSLLKGAAPAVLLLPWAVRRAASTRMWRGLPRQRFAFAVFASLFVAFTLLPQKQKHYMLPLLPSLAILLADGALARAELDPASFARIARRLGYAAAAVALVGMAWAAAWELDVHSSAREGAVLAGGGALLAAGLVTAARRGSPAHVAGAGVAATLAVMLLYGLIIEPHQPPPGEVVTASATERPSPESAR